MHTSRTPGPRITALAASSLVLAFALTGCGLQFVPDQSQSKPATSEQQPQADSPSQQTPDADVTDTGNKSDDSAAAMMRSEFEGTAQRIASCSGGVLDIDDVGGVLQLDSDCAELVVSGSGTVVLAENVGKLRVTGVGLTIFVKDLGAVDVSGTGSTVVWESGKATVHNSGTGNTLLPAN